MSESVAPTPPAAPAAPEPKKTNWLLIGGIVVGVLALCVCVVCVGGPTLLTLMGPQIGGVFMGTLCGIQYSDLSSDQCANWAADVMTNHSDEYLECNAQATDSSGSTDMNTLFACLEDKGLGPRD